MQNSLPLTPCIKSVSKFLYIKIVNSKNLYKFISFVHKYQYRDHSQTPVRGHDAKAFYHENFLGPPFKPHKFQGPFLPWKLWVNPIEKHVNSIFTGKFVIIFQALPLQEFKHFEGPPTSVCEWSLTVGSGVEIHWFSSSAYSKYFSQLTLRYHHVITLQVKVKLPDHRFWNAIITIVKGCHQTLKSLHTFMVKWTKLLIYNWELKYFEWVHIIIIGTVHQILLLYLKFLFQIRVHYSELSSWFQCY